MSDFSEKLNLLVLENSSENFLFIKDKLEEQFNTSEIHYVTTTADAGLILKENRAIQLILVDLPASTTDAENLIHTVLQLANIVPVVALIPFSNKDFSSKLRSLGVADYLFKEGLTSIYLYKTITDTIDQSLSHVRFYESEEKYKKLFKLSPFPHWVFDTKTLKFLYVNEAAIAHYGYSREEFLSMTIKDIRPPEDIRILNEIIESRAKSRNSIQSIVRHRKKNGEIIFVKIESNWIKFKDKEARLILALDITESIKAQQELKESEYRFKALVQEGSDLISIMDENGVLKYVSPTIEAVLGLKTDELLGNNVFDYIHADDLPRIQQEIEALKVKKRIELSPYRFRNANNEYRWLEAVITDMSDDPLIAGIVSNCRDITLRIENEIKTQESIDRYTAVSKATSDTIYEWDFKTNVVKWNRGIHGIFGYKKITETDLTWWMSHIHPEDKQRVKENLIQSEKKKKERWQEEYRFRCEDGCYKYVLDRSFIIYDKGGEPIKMIGSMQDITETVHYIKEIEAQNTRLKEISWTQSHKVRAPLARLMGLIEVFKNYPHTDKNILEMLEYMTSSAQELDSVICSIINTKEHQ